MRATTFSPVHRVQNTTPATSMAGSSCPWLCPDAGSRAPCPDTRNSTPVTVELGCGPELHGGVVIYPQDLTTLPPVNAPTLPSTDWSSPLA